MDEVALGEPPAELRLAVRRRGGARRSRSYSSSKSSATRDQSSSGRAVVDRVARSRATQLRVAQQALELGGERERVARLEQQARARRRARSSSYCGRRDTTGTAPPAMRAQHELRRRRGAGRRRHGDRGACEVLGLGAVGRAGEPHALAQPPRQRDGRRRGRVAEPDRGAPVEVAWAAAAARAGTAAARRAPPRPRTRSRAAPRRVRPGGRSRSAPGMDHGVVAGEVALDQVAGGGEARGAAVEPAEEELHHLARHLGRDEALGGGVEGADVQRARVAQRRRRRARRERLVHVDEVELGALEQLLERARHVERQRHRAAAPERQRLARRRAPRRSPGRPQSASGSDAQRLDRRAPVADQLARVRRRDHHHAVAAPAQLVRQPLDEAVDLVVLLPGPRGYLRNSRTRGGYAAGVPEWARPRRLRSRCR